MLKKSEVLEDLTRTDLIDMYRTMLLARKIDERLWLLNRSGKIPFVVSCQGQEAAQAGAAFALDREKDYILPYYRDLGMVLAFGMTARDVMLFNFAKAADPNSGGRQMPGHFGQKKNRILTISSPVTTQVPHAVGISLAGKMERKDFVSFVSFGEGSSNQGDFHEGANFAGVHKLPVIFFVENNQYAISVPADKQLACEKISDRAIGYGMPGVTVDGNDPIAVYQAVREAADRGRRGEGPTLIEAVTYRLTAHSSDDDDRSYRTKEEVDEAWTKDGVQSFSRFLKEQDILTGELEEKIQKEMEAEIDDATDFAENAADPEADTLFQYVYGD